MNRHSPALADYAPAFTNPDEPFLTYHHLQPGRGRQTREFTRGEFWSLACRAAHVLREHGLGVGSCFAHYFTANRVGDLAFRLAAAMTGATPVTVNWQADTPERIAFKIELTGCRLVVADAGTPSDVLESLRTRFPGLAVFALDELPAQPELPPDAFCPDVDHGTTRIIIFTSGTTGRPKGVRLPYRSYVTNRSTFESFLQVQPDDCFAPVIVNPMHHTNSTAFTDWALRRPGTHLHLIERYSTQYWRQVTAIAGQGYDRIVAPTVSRHFDFLENLRTEGRLPVGYEDLQTAAHRIDFLLGSAPVGPTTVARLQELGGRVPMVRFGSTETCLQVMGTPRDLSEEDKLRAFQRGWAHTHAGEAQPGYYVGRPHPGNTECRVVHSTVRGEAGYFADCDEGEPGRLITRGRNVMEGYVKDPDATRGVLHDGGWYTGLGDVCFWLANEHDGARDYYWMSRETALLIRGGANYAYAQISDELKSFVEKRYNLPPGSFDLAVVGLLIGSEHEDDCCVTVELISDQAKAQRADMEATFLTDARAAVSKGARPDRLRFAEIPRNFKGAILVPELKEQFRADL